MKNIHLIAGLPRSGSTLLCNILNMNQELHATPTSYTLDILKNIRSGYSQNITAKSHDRLESMDNIQRAMSGFLHGFYSTPELNNKTIFDKSRGWTNNLDFLDQILANTDTKIIWTYRNPLEIISSIESQYRKTLLLESIDEANGLDYSTIESRVNTYIADKGIVGNPVWLLNDAIEKGYGERIMVINYNDLTLSTQETMDRIHTFLGIKQYNYSKNNFSDLTQTTQENDGVYNYKFSHSIVPGMIKHKKHEINLPSHLISAINQRFTWINNIASTTCHQPKEPIIQDVPKLIIPSEAQIKL